MVRIKEFRKLGIFPLVFTLSVTPASGVYAAENTDTVQNISQAEETERSALSDAIGRAQSVDPSLYTPESLEVLNQAAVDGSVLLNDPEASEDSLSASLTLIEGILTAGLVPQTDKTALGEAISQAETCTDATQDGYEELQTVITQAREVYSDGNATQAEGDAQIQAISVALAGLGGGVDKSVLNDLISQAEALDISSSDPASVSQLQTAIASARQVTAASSSTQTMVNKHIQLLQAAASAMYEKTQENVIYDGTYEINGALRHATADQVSMGNDALVKPFQLIKKGNTLTLRIECKALTASLGKTDFTGYISRMWYFPGMTDENVVPHAGEENSVPVAAASETNSAETSAEDLEQVEVPAAEETSSQDTSSDTEELFVDDTEDLSQTAEEVPVTENAPEITQDEVPVQAGASASAKAVNVESWYDIYDSYNDPKTGTDANVKGQKYPHYITLPVELNQSLVWTQIYVPVMEAISKGSGKQYAKMYLYWDSLKQISGTQSDKSALKNGITKARKVLAALQKDAQGYASEQLAMLSQAITTGRAVYYNLNVDQTIVDQETEYLTKAINTVSKTSVDSDKTELKKAISTANSYLNEKEVDYAKASLDALKTARDHAREVYDNPEATQTEVNKCVTAIDTAIRGLVIDGSDRRELGKTLKKARARLKETESYSAASIQSLQTVYDQAYSVYTTKGSSQEEVDAQNGVVSYILANMKKIGDTAPNRSSLHQMLMTASNMAGREDLYTAASLKALNKAIKTAQAVYDKSSSTQQQIDAQVSALSKAIRALIKDQSKNENTNSNKNNSGGSSDNGNSDSKKTETDEVPDINNLKDGVYSVTGKMLKTDKTSASMSDEAINHTVKLTAKNGSISVTLDFKGLTINGQQGYLGNLKYFREGYKTDSNQAPSGSSADVTVESVQTDSSGNVISDSLGTNYPDVVTFPLIKEAKKDGFVPLQVFVPIMDSISKGTGTQAVYLKLDWNTLKKTSADDDSFKTDDNNGGFDSDSQNNTSTGGNSSLGGNSALGTNSSLKTGGSSLGGNSSLSTSGNTTSLKASESASLSGGKSLSATDKKSGSTGTTKLKSSAASLTGSDTAIDGNTADQSSKEETSTVQSEKNTEKKSASAKTMVPMSMSALAALAGILYKLKNRPRKKK